MKSLGLMAVIKSVSAWGVDLLNDINTIGGVFGGLAVLSGIALLVRATITDALRSYRFLRRVNAGTPNGGFAPAASTVLSIASRDKVWRSLRQRPLFSRVRMRAEHEIFDPKPILRWPPSVGDKHYQRFHARENPLTKAEAYKAHKAAVATWRSKMRSIYADGMQDIELESPADMNSRFDEIKRYFDSLKETPERKGESFRHFVCHVSISEGFVTPLHLLTGLLIHFDSGWKSILDAFDRDASQSGGFLSFGKNSRDIRQIQMFIYNCWLLWGPSIPLCTCLQWNAPHKVVQYGFGDENNSIEIVGERETIDKSLSDVIRAFPLKDAQPMAFPAAVRGMLRLSGAFKAPSGREADTLPRTARDSWIGGQDERPLLYVTREMPSDVTQGNHVSTVETTGHIKSTTAGADQCSHYYSAYLWIALAAIKKGGSDWIAASMTEGKREAWKDLVPFFEHGNLADGESCLFAKRQLAVKVLNAMAMAAQTWSPAEEPRVRFAYACAIDDSGCEGALAHPDWAGLPSMKELLSEALDDAVARHEVGSIYQRMRDQKIIDFDHYEDVGRRREYSACRFPAYVAEHYRSMAGAP